MLLLTTSLYLYVLTAPDSGKLLSYTIGTALHDAFSISMVGKIVYYIYIYIYILTYYLRNAYANVRYCLVNNNNNNTL